MAKLLVIHGPNLNLLGTREADKYGKITLNELNAALVTHAKGHELTCFQSNAEHEIVEKIHHAKQNGIAFIILNAAALTHTSIVLRDALTAIAIPFIEVHLTNIYAREVFRHYSYLSDIAVGSVSGLGKYGYFAALQAAIDYLH